MSEAVPWRLEVKGHVSGRAGAVRAAGHLPGRDDALARWETVPFLLLAPLSVDVHRWRSKQFLLPWPREGGCVELCLLDL